MKTILKYVMAAVIFAGANVCAMKKEENKNPKKFTWYYKENMRIENKIDDLQKSIGQEKKEERKKELNKQLKKLRLYNEAVAMREAETRDNLFDWFLRTPSIMGLLAVFSGGLFGYLVSDKVKINSKISMGIHALTAFGLSYFPQLAVSYKLWNSIKDTDEEKDDTPPSDD